MKIQNVKSLLEVLTIKLITNKIDFGKEDFDAHFAALLRHASAGSRYSTAADSAVPRPQQSADDDDLSASDAHGGG